MLLGTQVLFVSPTYNSAMLAGFSLSQEADVPHGPKMAAAVPGVSGRGYVSDLGPFIS